MLRCNVCCAMFDCQFSYINTHSRPSSRVTAAKRRLVLVNDAQAKLFDPKNVECALCSTQVKLEGEGDFNLIKWDEHKVSCTTKSVSPFLEKQVSDTVRLDLPQFQRMTVSIRSPSLATRADLHPPRHLLRTR